MPAVPERSPSLDALLLDFVPGYWPTKPSCWVSPWHSFRPRASTRDRIEELSNDLIKKQKTYILYNLFHPVVSNEDEKYYPYYECAFDFEAVLKKVETKDNEKKLQIVSEHVQVSVSIFSNVPEYDDKPILFVQFVSPNYYWNITKKQNQLMKINIIILLNF